MLVQSQLMYGSQLWNPYLIKDITTLERIQRRATKFILNDYISNYKSHLLELDLSPLIYFGLSYFVKHYLNVQCISISSTLSNSPIATLDHQLANKLQYLYSSNNLLQFYIAMKKYGNKVRDQIVWKQVRDGARDHSGQQWSSRIIKKQK